MNKHSDWNEGIALCGHPLRVLAANLRCIWQTY